MKKQLIRNLLLLLLCSNFIYGQKSDTITTYFNRNWVKTNKDVAVYFRKTYPDPSGVWIVKDYHMNGQLQMSGTYSDRKLKKQQGPTIFYHFNGKISSIGSYLNNKEVGLWRNYHKNGNIYSVGKMSNDKNDSTWTYYNLDGTYFGNVNFINGKTEGESKWYYESGKACEIATYKDGKLKSKINFDEDGNIIKISEEDCNPEFIGGNDKMLSFLQENIKYPEELQQKGKEGIVLFYFIVRKDGKIEDIQYEKTDEELFNKEAERVFSLIKYMKPARSHGRIIEQECTMPIAFRLK